MVIADMTSEMECRFYLNVCHLRNYIMLLAPCIVLVKGFKASVITDA